MCLWGERFDGFTEPRGQIIADPEDQLRNLERSGL
jgi:hypothetical protein